MPVLPSVRAARTGRISLSFSGRAFVEICRESRCAVAAGHFTCVPTYVLVLPATLDRHKSALFE